VGAASVVLAIPALLGPLADRIQIVLESRYTRTALLSVMVMALVLTTLVLKSPSPEIVYKQF
jgi:hypothetical protein